MLFSLLDPFRRFEIAVPLDGNVNFLWSEPVMLPLGGAKRFHQALEEYPHGMGQKSVPKMESWKMEPRTKTCGPPVVNFDPYAHLADVCLLLTPEVDYGFPFGFSWKPPNKVYLKQRHI